MDEIIVDAIFEDGEIRVGTVSSATLVFKILEEMLGLNGLFVLTQKIKENPQTSFYSFTTFHQYVVLIRYDPEMIGGILGDTRLSLKLSDYGNSDDNALDDYLNLTEWTIEQRNESMKKFSEIQKKNPKRIPMKGYHIS